MMKYYAASAVVFLFLFHGGSVNAYEVLEVKNGAAVKGTVLFSGTVPADEIVTVNKDQEVCGANQIRGKYIVNNARVKNAVVWIEDIKQGKSFSKNPVNITLKNCKTEPHVNVGFVGGKFVFRNDDDILHTVQLKLGVEYQKKYSSRPVTDGATIYNLALPNKGVNIEKPIKGYYRYSKDTGFIQITSNTHECIQGYVFVFDHPYAAVSDDQGSFLMDGLPPGEYAITAWHEGFGTKQQHITVKAGDAAHVEIEFK
jgi:hypothetical protein